MPACPNCGYVSVFMDRALITRTVPCSVHEGRPPAVATEPVTRDPLPRRRLLSRVALA